MSAEDSRDPSVPQSFETLGEHYQLRKKLGEGAFGVVYLAHHDLLDQDFAVKILKPELCEDQNLRDRFLDEARALIRFSHTNVVQLRHVGSHENRLYLVMDLVRGEALDDLLGREGGLGEKRAVNITMQVLAGLEAAHNAGIVHRDLKPSNLIVESTEGKDYVRILDFGLSKLSAVDGMQSAHRSVTGAIIGTLAYMSPEQLSGEKEIDARSDVFAAGLVLHEMLAGQHPYPGDSGIMVAAKLLREPVPPIDAKLTAQMRPSTLSALDQALQRDRDARFSSAFAFAQALEGRGPPSDTSRVTTIQDARQALARAEAAAGKPPKGGKSKKGLVIGAIVVLLAAVGAFLATQGSDEPPKNGGRAIAKTPETPPVTPEPPPDTPETPPVTPEPPPDTPEVPPVTPEPPPDTPETPPVTPEPPPDTPEVPPVTPPDTPEVPPDVPEVPPETPETPPVTPEPPVEVPTPVKATPEIARELATAGRFLDASSAWRDVVEETPKNFLALRGAAMTWLEEAGRLARHGRLDEAKTTLDDLIAWLTKMHDEVYVPAYRVNRTGMEIPLGVTLMHRGEAWTEQARWYRVAQNAEGEKKAMKAASKDLGFAWQELASENEVFWDFRLRRAAWHYLNGDPKAALEDLEGATKLDSDLVEPHMWVAHFNGLRRKAEGQLASGADAEKTVEEAWHILERGEKWARTRKTPFTRDQWLDGARALYVRHLALKSAKTREENYNKMSWFLKEARALPARAWESPEFAEALLLPHEAALLLAEAGVLARKEGQAEASRDRVAQAVEKAQRAVALREAIEAGGGELVSPYPYVMLGHALHAAGRADESAAAMQKAAQATRRNPE